jgi:hypothetical protein
MTQTTLNPLMNMATLPARMRHLPIGPNGYIVPWFVGWLPNGEPEFRAMDPQKWVRAVKERLCWVCGQKLGAHLVFVLGPMCAITRTTSEPACHRDCARWSAQNCPFITRPHMHRRENDLPETIQPPAGYHIARNPGVMALWITSSFKIFDDGEGRPLISVGPADEVEWYAEGRVATRAEVLESVRTGVPALEEVARQQDGGMEELDRQCQAAEAWYPAE